MFYNQIFFLVWVILCCTGDQFEDECGLEAVDSTPFVRGGLGGVKSKHFPWHVAIFHRTAKQFLQICGGSLVRSNLVITAISVYKTIFKLWLIHIETIYLYDFKCQFLKLREYYMGFGIIPFGLPCSNSAHCFSDRSQNHQVHVADYRVVGGSRLSSWNSTEIGRQESEMGEIRLGEEYGGSILHFEDDIAIIQLRTAFTFSDTVRAVCLDLTDTDLYTQQTSPGTMGKVAGWGLTESGTRSEILYFLRVPVVERVECIEKLPHNFKSFFTSDKICAGFTNGSAVCQGDSGGGLVFPLQIANSSRQRWFLRGVLSNAPSTQDLKNRCPSNVFALYTDLSKHHIWLSTQMADILPRGTGCRVRGSIGVCRNITDCPLANQELSLGIPPQYCPPPGQEICCEEPTCPPLPPSTVNQRKTSSKANDYCMSLAEKMYPCQKKGSSWSRSDLCGPEPDQRESGYKLIRLAKARPSEVQRFALNEGVPFFGVTVYMVSERWLLVMGAALDEILGLPGENTTYPRDQVFTITRRVPHPQNLRWNTTTDNLELVEMDKFFTFSRRFMPVCLHTSQDPVESLILNRRDMFSVNSSQPADLLPQEECSGLFPPGSIRAPVGVTDNHLCITANTWQCGAYGFFLTASNNHRVACTRLLVGKLLNFTEERGNTTCEQLYLRISPYVPWVESVVWP